ncbi:MAG: CPBP family intramembrane metalloprotease [Lachnospiraceae bacterium]|nr:CPBP family intramembrane metalloprotease [Lachnospiraceae bacterium]
MNQRFRNIISCFVPFLVYIGVMLVVMFCFAVYASATKTASAEELEQFVNDHLLLMTTIIDAILIPVFYLMWRMDRDKYPLKRVDMPDFSWAVLALIGASVCVGLNYFLNMFMPKEILNTFEETSEVLWNDDTSILSFVSVVLVAPLTEELMFRGLIYTRLRLMLKAPYTILITAFLFGLFHENLLQFIYAFVIGLILAYMMEAYRNLWAPIMVHAAANLISWLLTYAVQIPTDDGGALDYSVMGGTLLIAGTGLYSIVYIRKVKKNKANQTESEEEK